MAVTTPDRAAVRFRAFERCEWCGAPAWDIHHRKYRSRGGTDDCSNLVLLCGRGNTSGCHGRAHTDPEAVRLGFSVESWAEPATISIPSRIFRVPVFLLPNGDTSFDPPDLP
jgi:hypothetical protein